MKKVNSTNFVPRKIFLTKGGGVHKEKLASFELALRELINEEKSKLLDSLRDKTKGESIDEYLGIKE